MIVESQGPELATLQLALQVGGVTRPVQTDSLAGAGSDARPEPHGGQVEHSRGGDALGLQNLGVRQRQHVGTIEPVPRPQLADVGRNGCAWHMSMRLAKRRYWLTNPT